MNVVITPDQVNGAGIGYWESDRFTPPASGGRARVRKIFRQM
jgi:hypothetical protein